MRSKTNQHQNKHVVNDLIYQKPIRLDMAVPCSLIVPGKIMVAIFRIQCAAIRENIHNLKQLVQISVLFFRQLQIFLNWLVKVTNHQLSWWFGYAPPGQITRSA